jgi:hypothetical protein
MADTPLSPGALRHDEALQLVDECAREHTGMSGGEFARRWAAVELDDRDVGVWRTRVLLPLIDAAAPGDLHYDEHLNGRQEDGGP